MAVKNQLRDHHRIGWEDVALALQNIEDEHGVACQVILTPGYGGTRSGTWHVKLQAYAGGRLGTGRPLYQVIGWYPNGRATTAAAAVYRLVLELDYIAGGALPAV